MSEPIPLFRQQALAARSSVTGAVIVRRTRRSWTLMGGCALLLALCILLATRVSLPRVQRAPAITIASGAPLRIVASREGTILSLEVREGQRVAAGEVIAKLSNAENEEMATRELVERDESRDEKSLADQQMGRN